MANRLCQTFQLSNNRSQWIFEAEGKANCFADTFESKNAMIEANKYSDKSDAHPTFHCGLPAVEATEKSLKSLVADSARGPDKLQTRIQNKSAHALAPVLCK